ncbi:MAG TPA: threonine ammonia-lyase, partial [Candidatus Baltobacteraceae bacterium]|nr:threonine ammonia-lyase [Candidatus Baltobacteraceae bacterium]
TDTQAPTFADVEDAAAQLAGVAVRTPSVRAQSLSKTFGCDVVLKLESLQKTASFKARGAYLKIASLDELQRRRGVIAASAGNHAQGVAFYAAALGIPAKIVMPATTPFMKVRRTQAIGARVILHGTVLSEALEEALRLARDEGLTMIPGYDDPLVVAGAATAGLEMLTDFPEIDTLLVPVGGGGLLCGAAIVARHLQPRTQIIGVQTETYPSLYNALHDKPEPAGGATIAEGIGVKRIGPLNLRIIKQLVDDVLLVDEQTIEQAIYALLEEEKVVAEGAGAAGLAALMKYKARFAGKHVGLIVSGGNIDSGMLSYVIARAQLYLGRVARLDVQIVDTPGVLAQVAKIIGDFEANILEVAHNRTIAALPAKCASLQVTIEMRSPSDAALIAQRLRTAGLSTDVQI